ncbi:hypothetical protein BV898_14295 [Hypsibius exemplaris]|uniref:Uncharacterized protein n=1 Tax=Hypsibius exemplaris TaxID=2072580 RepID=A0A1W0W8C8_HYPEX|nr:hypothetical protein BV898_14295 [Hypsibius exemplaris]
MEFPAKKEARNVFGKSEVESNTGKTGFSAIPEHPIQFINPPTPSSEKKMNVPNTLTPISWKYGAIAAGVGLTQGLGLVWYSDQVFGPVWKRTHPVTAATMTDKDHATALAISAASDTAFAILLTYLSSRFFRPLTPTDAVLLAGIISGVQVLPKIGHAMWGKQKPDEFFVDHGFDFAGNLIKILCLMYIPY